MCTCGSGKTAVMKNRRRRKEGNGQVDVSQPSFTHTDHIDSLRAPYVPGMNETCGQMTEVSSLEGGNLGALRKYGMNRHSVVSFLANELQV